MRRFLWYIVALLIFSWSALSCPPRARAEDNQMRVSKSKRIYLKEREMLKHKLAQATDSMYVEKIFADSRCKIDSTLLYRKPRKSDYSFLFTDTSIAEGKRFFAEKREFLDSLEREFGVDAAVITAVYRAETNFGRYLGTHSVLQALYTRYFMRTGKKQLEEFNQLVCFLELARRDVVDVFSLTGSSAGAWGRTQFRPCSFVFAVDGSNDGYLDLFNERDALASAANYLRAHGWAKKLARQRSALDRYNGKMYRIVVLRYAKLISS
ncbi:MAG: lytic murein transglycosylase [Patescibacteria group bacterium]